VGTFMPLRPSSGSMVFPRPTDGFTHLMASVSRSVPARFLLDRAERGRQDHAIRMRAG